MNWRIAIAFVLGILPARSLGDNPPKSPAAPEGWQTVLSRDRTYQFHFPKNTQTIGYTSRKFTSRGIRAEVLMNYCKLRDGTFFDVEGAALSGRGANGLKDADRIGIVLEGQRQQGFTIGDARETTIGNNKATEYRMRKESLRCRAVLLVVKNRVIQLRICAPDEATLDSDRANAFIQSLSILKESPDGAPNEDTAAADERARAAMAKLGFKWTLKAGEMTAPDRPVSGLIHGSEFKPDTVVREAGGILRFRQGPKAKPDAEVRLMTFASPNEKFEDRTIEIRPDRKTRNIPTIILTTHDPATRVPTTSSFFDKYAMKLHFGAKGPDGMVPCTIYLCTTDAGKSFMAGTFKLSAK